MYLGHEGAAVVEKLGPCVITFKVYVSRFPIPENSLFPLSSLVLLLNTRTIGIELISRSPLIKATMLPLVTRNPRAALALNAWVASRPFARNAFFTPSLTSTLASWLRKHLLKSLPKPAMSKISRLQQLMS